MISLKLKAKHYYLVANVLFDFAAYNSFSILKKIKEACDGVNENDLVLVETDVDTITSVFQILSQKPEGSFNIVNGEMLDLLVPQIAKGVQNNDPEWIQLGKNVTEIRNNNFLAINQAIQSGKTRLES